ncbi:MAG: Hsp20/alpha crystallin family protein, partial [Deltaproteobacteria bacterium]|nr:Hsp20/alpha crystallin family protein [Deltaproteobacteria bacterium]
MAKKEKKEKKEEASFDFGTMGVSLGGFFKGLE